MNNKFKMLKRVLCIALVFLMGTFCIAFVGCAGAWRNYEFTEGDFILEISVDRTVVSVGDTIEVTVRLKNNSGQDLPVMFLGVFGGGRRDYLQYAINIKQQGWWGARPALGFPFESKTFKNGTEVHRKQAFNIHENNEFEVKASIFFHIGTINLFTRVAWHFEDYPSHHTRIDNRSIQHISIESPSIQIYVI